MKSTSFIVLSFLEWFKIVSKNNIIEKLITYYIKKQNQDIILIFIFIRDKDELEVVENLSASECKVRRTERV
jgi:response regulator of citrate/malate metabolism